jgi:predicted AlkP superfamily phosphohydrolase/phosphomutase
VVLRVDRSEDVYSAERRAEGPDLIVGYDRGYGASDESTLGEITEAVLEDNTSRWSGNHLMAPEVVPGILATNRKLTGSGYDLTDLTVALLAYYGIDPAPGMVGEPIH